MNYLSENELYCLKGQAINGLVGSVDVLKIFDIIEAMTEMLDEADQDDTFGTQAGAIEWDGNNMDFIKYNGIENHYNGKFIDFVRMNCNLDNVKWVVTEKLHGANYSFWSDGTEVKAAKRTGFIKDDENFYNHLPVFEKYKDAVLALAQEIGPCAVYGEIYGGDYPGVEKPANVSQVQKEVKYCPHIDFAAFDIYSVTKGEFLNHMNTRFYLDVYEIPMVPVLGIFPTLTEALHQPNEFLTKVPERFGLPEIEGNVTEGIVIAPFDPMYTYNGSRVIIKSKNERFKESAKVEKGKPTKSMLNDATVAVINQVRENLTENRMNNVVSKYGPDEQFVVLLKNLVEDAVADGPADAYVALTEEEQNFVRKAITAEAAQLVKRAKYAA